MRLEEKKNRSVSDLKKPLFSVIVLTYMQRHLLNECLDSILEQTYPNIELIVCDDCSADFDPEEVLAYINKNKSENIKNVIVYRHLKNVGTVRNAQSGVEMSSGVFFKLHAGDDMLYHENVLNDMYKQLKKPGVEIVAGRSIACQHDGTMTQDYYPSYRVICDMMNASAERQFEMIGTQSWGEYVNAPAVFWKRSLFDEVGGFDLSYRYTEDWPMWLKITAAGHAITMVNMVTTIYRYGGVSNNLSALNATIGKTHYEEAIRMMWEMVLPKFEAEGKRKKAIRCRQAVKCIEVRRDIEGQWDEWTSLKKLAWRVRELPFLLLSWLYRVKAYGAVWRGKTPMILMAACIVLFFLNAEIWPGVSWRRTWAVVFFVSFLWLLLKTCVYVCLKIVAWAAGRIGRT